MEANEVIRIAQAGRSYRASFYAEKADKQVDYNALIFMTQYQDEQGLFADINFKLLVIQALIDESFATASYRPEWLAKLDEQAAYIYDEYWRIIRDVNDKLDAGEELDYPESLSLPVPELCEFVAKLCLTQDELDMVTELIFDGSNEIYEYLTPEWDGDQDFFNVSSIDGWQHLKNLKNLKNVGELDLIVMDDELLEPMASKGIDID